LGWCPLSQAQTGSKKKLEKATPSKGEGGRPKIGGAPGELVTLWQQCRESPGVLAKGGGKKKDPKPESRGGTELTPRKIEENRKRGIKEKGKGRVGGGGDQKLSLWKNNRKLECDGASGGSLGGKMF